MLITLENSKLNSIIREVLEQIEIKEDWFFKKLGMS